MGGGRNLFLRGQYYTEFRLHVQSVKKSRVRINPDEFDRAAIRRTIHDFYACKEYPTLDKLLQKLCDKNIFHGDTCKGT